MSVLDLADAKAHLNITSTTNDGEIQGVIDAAEAAISSRIGPLAPVAVTARCAGGGTVLLLPEAPVLSVTSVTPTDGYTPVLDDGLLLLNSSAGTVEYATGGRFGCAVYDVTFVAGRATVPDDLLFAIKELVRHLWTSQRGGSSRPGAGGPEVPAPGYLIPNRVAELIEPYRVPRVA